LDYHILFQKEYTTKELIFQVRFHQKYGYSGSRDNPPSLCELWRDRRSGGDVK
jgi:hypothetical protein